MPLNYRLPTHIMPLEYHITISPIPPTYDMFTGKCIILFQNINPTLTFITLNVVNLKILKVKLISFQNNKIKIHHHLLTSYDSETQQVRFDFDTLPYDMGGLQISYTGNINTDLYGLYKCPQDDKIIMVTQFEAVYARRCIPSFDEPNFKSVFHLTLILPLDEDKLVLSNMDPKEIITDPNIKTYIFYPTPKMSIYLLAFYIGYGTFIEGKHNDVRVRIYSPRPQDCSKLALKTTLKCLKFMEDYFQYPYQLPKLDLITIPKFGSEAMENWGLITFREKVLLCNDNTKVVDIIDIIITICHELAHQWFGNLVTMDWWSELWLNESFATWMSYVATNHIYPKLNIDNFFFKDTYVGALKADSVTNSHPIKVDVYDPSLIAEIFDSVSYYKGASIIKMLAEYVGEKDFMIALRHYIKTYAYNNAITDNLWEYIGKVSKKDIGGLMDNWITQKNYPLVSINPHGQRHLEITQMPFTFKGNNDDNLWVIPLSDAYLLKEQQILFPRADLITRVNPNLFGFYTVLWHKDILKDMMHVLTEMDIANVMSDTYFLLKAGNIGFDCFIEYVGLMLKLRPISELVCNISLGNYGDFALIAGDNRFYGDILKGYIKGYDFKITSNDNLNQILLKVSILQLGYRLGVGEHKEYCRQQFIDFKNGKTLNSNIVGIVLKCGIECLGEFDFLMEQLLGEYENEIIEALPLVNNPLKYKQALDLWKNYNLEGQHILKLFAVAGTNKNMNKELLPYIKENWDGLYGKFKYTGMDKIIASMRYLRGDDILIRDMENFFGPKDKHGMEMEYKILLETLEINNTFYNRMKN